MKDLNTYLIFDGNARAAMTFYKECLEGDLQLMSFAEMPPGECEKLPPGSADRIMHACLRMGEVNLMASDTMPGMPFDQGNNFSININCESLEEIQRLFNKFGKGGKVTMELQDAFWGAHFGMLTDQFGVNWMFNFEKPKS